MNARGKHRLEKFVCIEHFVNASKYQKTIKTVLAVRIEGRFHNAELQKKKKKLHRPVHGQEFRLLTHFIYILNFSSKRYTSKDSCIKGQNDPLRYWFNFSFVVAYLMSFTN